MLDSESRDALLLPVAALRLAGRFFVPLALWFTAGSVVRYLLIEAISRLGDGDHLGARKALVLLPLSVAVLSSLAVAIGMMFTLGRGLSSVKDPDEPYLAAIGRTLLPFVLIYLGWNLYTADLRDVLRADAQRLVTGGDRLNAGGVLDVPVLLCLAVAAVSWGIRLLLERRGEEPGRVLGVVIAFFEVNFTLYGLYSITQLLRSAQSWLTDRVFWHAITGFVHLPGPGPVKDALVLPLVWLAVAAIVFGLETRDPIERLRDRIDGRHLRVAEIASRSLREKYLPVAHAVRLMARAGAPVFAWFCLCYVAIGAALDRLQRGVMFLFGTDHSVRFWNLPLVPVEFAHKALYEILRLALLAATFDLVTRRVTGGTPAPDRPEPVKDPGAHAA